MKRYDVAIIGCGGRGCGFACMLGEKTEQFRVAALCDTNPAQMDKIHKLIDIDTTDFVDPEEFFKEKRGDLLIIATGDRDHVPMGIRGLELGYDLFMEKPISDSREELKALLEAKERTGGQIIICHELRYGAGYRKCKELIESGIIGKLNVIDASERPYYWHWVQAYVRNGFATLDKSHPVILAKCSHDLDLIQYYAGSECDTVSSLGDLRFFKPENAPEGSADRCLDCKYVDTCPYSAKRIYVDMWHENNEPEFEWPYAKVSIDPPITEGKLYEGIKSGPYGKCAFKCNVEQVDHQVVQMNFKNGVKASLKMVYSYHDGRRYVFYGTLGEIIMDERTDDITVMPYVGKTEVIKLDTLIEGGHGHGGGDSIIMNELYGMLSEGAKSTTDISESVEAHLIGISAEESRKNGGAVVKVHQ